MNRQKRRKENRKKTKCHYLMQDCIDKDPNFVQDFVDVHNSVLELDQQGCGAEEARLMKENPQLFPSPSRAIEFCELLISCFEDSEKMKVIRETGFLKKNNLK
jgi:hypothetical protein